MFFDLIDILKNICGEGEDGLKSVTSINMV